jgi:K+-transporting ATPase KdpF subunit
MPVAQEMQLMPWRSRYDEIVDLEPVGGIPDEPGNLAIGDVPSRPCGDGTVFPVLESLHENLRDEVKPMIIYAAAAVAVFLFIYLVVTLIRPEWF